MTGFKFDEMSGDKGCYSAMVFCHCMALLFFIVAAILSIVCYELGSFDWIIVLPLAMTVGLCVQGVRYHKWMKQNWRHY